MKRHPTSTSKGKRYKVTKSRSVSQNRTNCGVSTNPNVIVKAREHSLCVTCQAMVKDSYILNGRHRRVKVTLNPWDCEEHLEQFVHLAGVENLHASALEGCHLCILLWDNLDYHAQKGYFKPLVETSDEDGDTSQQVTYGPTFLHNLGPWHKLQERRARDRARLRQLQLEELGSLQHPAIIVQITCRGDGLYDKIDLIKINVEPNGVVGNRLETNARRALNIRPHPGDKKREWEANQDDPIEDHHDAQISLSTASDSSFDLARKWLNTCLNTHHLCRQAHLSALALPARLVDLGDSAIGDGLCLRTTADIEPRPDYLTLSHCWGRTKIIQLLRKNLKAFHASLPRSRLSATFQDAITITQGLGYRFLWIDSLCIVQDSPEDWESESALMGDIYRGSVCTISALGAEDGDGGCFVNNRNPLKYRPCIISGDANKGMVARGMSLGTIVEGPLLNRAWVVQERTLSPRTLHYGKEGIYWECIECDASESWPHGNTWDWYKDKRYRRPKEAFQSLLSARLFERKESKPSYENFRPIHHAWYEILLRYSQAALTQRHDMLVAIHGIIRKVEASTGLINVAGLWKQFLLPELLWNTHNPETMRPDFLEPSEYRAPTWAWASVNTGVFNRVPDLVEGRYENILGMTMWISYSIEWKAEILDVSVTAKKNGRVTDGSLSIKGPMRKIEWRENSGLEGLKHNRQARSTGDCWLPDFRAATSWELWGILIACGYGSSVAKDARIDVGLCVEPVKGQENVFRRFGIFQQCYWVGDTYPMFAGQKGQNHKIISMV